MSKTSAFLAKQPVKLEGEAKLLAVIDAVKTQKPIQFGATAGGWAMADVIRTESK